MKAAAILLGVVMAVSTFAVASVSLAAANGNGPMNFRSVLSGENEVPARDTQARGVAIFQLQPDGRTLTFKLIVANIDNAFMAHIHCGAADVNGPVRVFLFGPVPAGGGRTDGVIGEGSADISGITCPNGGTLLNEILAGRTYTNVHTSDGNNTPNEGPGDFPGGEIRGQLF